MDQNPELTSRSILTKSIVEVAIWLFSPTVIPSHIATLTLIILTCRKYIRGLMVHFWQLGSTECTTRMARSLNTSPATCPTHSTREW
jgi:hypothetical protein